MKQIIILITVVLFATPSHAQSIYAPTLATHDLQLAAYDKRIPVYRVGDGNTIYSNLNTPQPAAMTGPYNVRGIEGNETLVGVDTRSDGHLYALAYDSTTYTGRLYKLYYTGAEYTATPLGDDAIPLYLLTPAKADVRFMPGADNQIRVRDGGDRMLIFDADDGTMISTGIAGRAYMSASAGAYGSGGAYVGEADVSAMDVPVYSPSNTDNTSDLLVYPNPVIDQTRIILGTASVSNVYVDIIDMNGQVDRTYRFGQGSTILTVDMSFLPNGMYSMRVYGKGIGAHNLKVVKWS